MLQWINTVTAGKPLLAIFALIGLSTCTSCTSDLVQTKTAPAVERLLEAADGPLEEIEASLDVYYAVGATYEEICYDVPAAERAPLETCEAAKAALNATAGIAEIVLVTMADAEAARIVYKTYDTAKGEEGLLAAQQGMIEATSLAISIWTRTRPRIEAAIKTIGKAAPPETQDAPPAP